MADNTSTNGAGAALWRELSVMLRELRLKSGMSLREAESRSGWGRGSLSQIETAKARPTRPQAEWYDREFGADGLVVSLYAEARGAHGPVGRELATAGFVSGDRFEIVSTQPAQGEVVAPGASVAVRWTLRNVGSVPWHDRSLERVGSRNARGLIESPGDIVLPDCAPGDVVDVGFDVTVPDVAATFVAYWQVIDGQGRPCYDASRLLRVSLVTHPLQA